MKILPTILILGLFILAGCKTAFADTTPSAAPQTGYEYTVHDGDAVEVIAQAYRDQGVEVRAEQILAANPGVKTTTVLTNGLSRHVPESGVKLFIPGEVKQKEEAKNSESGVIAPIPTPTYESPHYFDKAPFISPRIIQDLSCGISDVGDQVVAINLLQAQYSNRYYGETKTAEIKGQNPSVYIESARVDDGVTNIASFGYQLIGKTSSDICVLETSDNDTSASGSFRSIMLVKFERDKGIIYDMNNDVVKSGGERLIIRKLGEFALGDRWDGDLRVEGNCIVIGKDNGVFAGTKKGGDLSINPTNRVVKIELDR